MSFESILQTKAFLAFDLLQLKTEGVHLQQIQHILGVCMHDGRNDILLSSRGRNVQIAVHQRPNGAQTG